MTLQRLTKTTLALVFFCTVSWVLMVALAFPPELQAQTFSLKTIPVEGNSDDVLAVDLNHDFLPDLVLLDRAGRVVSTYLNQGSGTFLLSFSYPLPDTPVSLDAIDNDENGHLDLIIGNATHASFLVFGGNGNGTFFDSRPYSTTGWPVSVSAFGNRGYPSEPGSAAVMAVAKSRISISEGRPQDVTFVEGGTVYESTEPGELTQGIFADFDHNTSLDIVVAHRSPEPERVTTVDYLASGYPPQVIIREAGTMRSLVPADIRQDGNLGFLATFVNGTGRGVAVFTGSGWGTFSLKRLFIPVGYDIPQSPQLIDYNGDGLADIAAVAYHRTPAGGAAPHDAILLWTANRDGTYKSYIELFKFATTSFDTASDAMSLRTADLNADGKLDLVLANPKAHSISILTNTTPQATICLPRTDRSSVVSCSPVDGAVIDATDLRVNCSAHGSAPSIGCTVLIDGVQMFSSPTPAFEQRLVIPSGKHVVQLFATDGWGNSFSTYRHITFFNRYLATCKPGDADTMNFCIPSRDNASVISPARIFATASSNNVVTATDIYVDDQLVFQGGMFLDERLPIPNGSHRIVTKGWNRNGLSFMASRMVNVIAQSCPAGATLTINICAPGNGATLSSPIHIEASANSDSSITGWSVYLNGKNIFRSFDGSNLSTDLVLPKGDQTLFLKAWDSRGRILGPVMRTIHVQ
jgi:hypothetical protein